MPQPTSTDVHVDTPLTNLSVGFKNDMSNFIADRVFPSVPVAKQTDKYFTYTQDDFFRTDARLRAPGTESAGSGYNLSTATYSCDVIALHKDIDDATRANADAPLDMNRDAVEFLTQHMLLKRELDWASTFFTETAYTNGVNDDTGGVVKFDAANAIENIQAKMDAVEGLTGYRPNKLVCGVNAFTELKNNSDVLDRIKYTQQGVATEQLLASLLGLEEVLVARAIRNTANEGATASYSRIYGASNALLAYAPKTPSLMHPSLGYTFTWSGYQGSNQGQRVSRFRMDHLRSDRIEMEMAYDQKLVSSSLGFFFTNTTTA
tara:strand:+ start:776 stop:1732 length:957 start_codon:yes stop_codon:yes gene_type:complete